MHRELPKFLLKLKSRGFKVKLDTNGFYPAVLKDCLSHVDYVAMDLKTCLNKYEMLGAKDTSAFLQSIEVLKNSDVRYEFRTTLVPEFVKKEDVYCLGELAKGAKTYVLQQFVSQDTLDKRFENMKPYEPDFIKEFGELLKKYVKNVVIKT